MYKRQDLRKAQERAHILEGLIIASDNIDEVIRIIRAAKTPNAVSYTHLGCQNWPCLQLLPDRIIAEIQYSSEWDLQCW